MSFAEYTRYYFTQKYGLRAVAKRHLGEFLYTMEQVKFEDRRVQLFHILLGLSAHTYTPHINHAFFRCLRRLLSAQLGGSVAASATHPITQYDRSRRR